MLQRNTLVLRREIELVADPSWTDVVSTVAVTLQTVAILAALIYARSQLVESRNMREASDRPFVVVDFDPDILEGFIYLIVSNQGRSLARDVRFTFDPPLRSTFDDTGYGVAFMAMFDSGLPTLSPGRTTSVLFDAVRDRFNSDDTYPDTYTVTIKYRGEGARQYSESLLLDLAAYKNRLSITRRTVHDIHGEIEKLRKVIEKAIADGPS